MNGICTDLYQLTMAQGYWKNGLADREAVFYHTFRKNPHDGGFTVFCGLSSLIDFFDDFGFSKEDIEYLADLEGGDGKKIFDRDFLKYLLELRFTCDIDSVVEGTPVFPFTPILRIRGPLIQCQILETPVLNILNHQTLIATKASRICLAAGSQDVLEFGFRRAHGPDGALSCSRAAYIGGCSATSNVNAGKKYGIPVSGTMAHSWVMMFGSEIEAFESYAEISGDSYVLLVDTYDTINGVRNAVHVARKMAFKGKELKAIRLDSGDIASLSIESRKILDHAGLKKTKIIASNDLDEYVINDIKKAGAPVDAWGVGTKLVTSSGHSALDGVYKLSAICKESGSFDLKMKLSNQPFKNSLPGILQTRRFFSGAGYLADIVYDDTTFVDSKNMAAFFFDGSGMLDIDKAYGSDELLKNIYSRGQRTYSLPGINYTRKYARDELERLSAGIKNIYDPEIYTIGIEKNLMFFRNSLAASLKNL